MNRITHRGMQAGQIGRYVGEAWRCPECKGPAKGLGLPARNSVTCGEECSRARKTRLQAERRSAAYKVEAAARRARWAASAEAEKRARRRRRARV